MKFLKKLVVANAVSPITFSSDLAYTDTFLSFCLCNLEKLTHRINKYFVIRKKAHLEWKFTRFQQKILDASSAPINNSHIIDWAPLIKNNAAIKNATTSNSAKDCSDCHLLAGRSVLCVGGRATLYPEYNQLIENSGGSLVTFHGDRNDQLSNLPPLLEQVDMIICPVDCVNHEAFLMVKYYCQCFGKLCVLLDRSEINTFSTGINVLATLASAKACN
ncbi:uncharacterized protein DUF2325 [Nitrosomonas sp. Nm84]|uniref:DUF2325 domain-containing protein n=1 Tax=Nitrosomonas sp. Nm84 TaxID=200124 RepID=UPI000D76DF7E|nr:DUF2325 domain-containing protein [Nitrosomonas sp. Nm84]PXW87817.1 uncharacterized protein DUF2325 [Nitrosomonas sp. Nm84]